MEEPSARRCRRCLLPEAFPGLRFDDTSLCSLCQSFPSEDVLAERRADILRTMAAVIDANRGARPYECVLAFSGGKDSSYTLKLLVEEHRLRCIAVTIDNGFLSSDTAANCRAVCGALGVDHVLFTPSRAFMQKMYRTSAEREEVHAPAAIQRASSICNSCIGLVNTHILRKALELGAPLVAGGYLGGQLPRDGSVMTIRPGQMLKIRSAAVNRFVEFFGEEARTYFELSSAAVESARTITVLNPMLGMSIHEDEIIASLEPLGWRRPVDTGITSTNCRLNDLGVFMHTRRHGFHPYALEIAEQLRHGLLTRDEALAKLETLPTREDVAWLADRIGVGCDV